MSFRAASLCARYKPRKARKIGVAAMFAAAIAALCGCSEEPVAETKAESSGGLILTMRPPPEAPALWPLAQGWRLVVTRAKDAVGTGAQVALDTDKPAEAPRVQAFAGELTALDIVLQDGDGAVRARAVTPPLFVEASDDDRPIPAFLAPAGADAKVVTLVGSDGAPVKRSGKLGEALARSGSGELFFTGGAAYNGGHPCSDGAMGEPTDAIERLSPLDHSLAAPTKMSTPRAFHTATALPGGRIALVGGYVTFGRTAPVTTASVDLLMANQGTVAAAPNGLKTARARHCAVAVGGRLVVAGGDGPGGSSIELWDPGVGTVASATLLRPRRDCRCALVVEPVDEKLQVWLVGGSAASGPVKATVDSIEVWTVDGSKLLMAGTLAQPAGQVSQLAAAMVLSPRGVLIAGGFGPGGTDAPLGTSWFHPLPGTAWSPGAALSSARGCPTAQLLGDRAFVAGGMAADGQPVATVDVLDVSGGKVKLAASRALPAPRAAAASIATAGRALLFSGGVQRDNNQLVAADRLLWMWP